MIGYYGRTEIYIKSKHFEAMMLSLFWWLILLPGVALASLQEETAVHASLRMADGTAVVGETVTLERLPEGNLILPSCFTDANGRCTWYVSRGLYQVLFTRPLDDISSLAVAEGGLQGLGITVGDEAITYHFTFHTDGRVYFDTTPEADRPTPFIPTEAIEQGSIRPTVTASSPASLTATLPTTNTIPVAATPTLDTAVANTPIKAWRVLIFIAVGLIIGGVIHLWSQKHPKTDKKTTRLPDQETKNA